MNSKKSLKELFIGVLIGIGLCMIFTLSQFLVVGALMIMNRYPYEVFIDITNISCTYYEYLVYKGIMGGITFVATGFSASIFVLWYYLLEKKKKSKLSNTVSKQLLADKLSFFIFITFFMIWIVSYINNFWGSLFPDALQRYSDLIEFVYMGSPLLLFFEIVILAPIGEDCLFRGVYFHYLKNRNSIATAIIIQSIFFAILHLNIFQGTGAIIMGTLCGCAVYWTNSVKAGIFIHMINNLIGFSLHYFPNIIGNQLIFNVIGIMSGVICILIWKKKGFTFKQYIDFDLLEKGTVLQEEKEDVL